MRPFERRAMGAEGRAKMEREFDERLVIGAYLRALGPVVSDERKARWPTSVALRHLR